AVIARCINAGDVISALAFARSEGLDVAVRCGAHSAGHASVDGGLQIDLSPIGYVNVDPADRVARVGGGAALGDVDHATHACGLVWCNTAPAERATEAMDTFRSLATPMLDGVGEMPFPALQSAFDPLLPFGTRMYWRGGFVNEVPDAAIAEYKRFGESAPTW